jgi:hypothetical protein
MGALLGSPQIYRLYSVIVLKLDNQILVKFSNPAGHVNSRAWKTKSELCNYRVFTDI